MKNNKILLYPLSGKKALGMSSSNRRLEISSPVDTTYENFKHIFEGDASEGVLENFGNAYGKVSENSIDIKINKCISLSSIGSSDFSEELKDKLLDYPSPDLNGRELKILLYCLNNDTEEIDEKNLDNIKYDYILPVVSRRYELQAGPLIMGDSEECTLQDLRDRRLAIAVSPKHESASSCVS